VALRHAVLAALLDAEASGYQLAKIFDVSVANFWHAVPQQLYTELARLEADGLLTGREVVQQRRPNKRVFTITERGRAALREFIAGPAKPSFIRDDLLVKVHAAEAGDFEALARELEDRAAQARARIDLINGQLARLRGDRTEEQYLAGGPRIGPYLTGIRGRLFEAENAAWCAEAARVLRARTGHAVPAAGPHQPAGPD
jgi:DNA-binding PadR family transcriptional regulator